MYGLIFLKFYIVFTIGLLRQGYDWFYDIQGTMPDCSPRSLLQFITPRKSSGLSAGPEVRKTQVQIQPQTLCDLRQVILTSFSLNFLKRKKKIKIAPILQDCCENQMRGC